MTKTPTSPIKVLHTEWSGGWGGQEMRIYQEMMAMRELGVEVHLASTAHSQITAHCLAQGIPCHILPFRGNADFKTLFGLIKIIRKNHIDIVNTHSGKDTWVGGLAAKFTRRKFIRTRHLSNPINPARSNFINELADHVLTTGHSIRNAMIKNNRIKPDNITSLPTGVDETRFDPALFSKEECRQKLDIQQKDIAIGMLAILRRFKRHDIFLQAAANCIKQRPNLNLKFFIAGDGPQADNINTLINELNIATHVNCLGYVKQPEAFLAAMDCIALTSDSGEGVPQALIQALMMRCPVIATTAGSISDLSHENNLILVPPNDIDAVTTQMLALIDSEALRDQYRKQARDYVVEKFSRQKMAHFLLTLYRELIDKKK